MTDVINWLLITAANIVLGVFWGIVDVAGTVFSALSDVLNPVLSPALSFLNPITTAIGDGVYAVLSPLPDWLGLTILSTAAGLVMLVVFRFASNQTAIGRAKDDIKANLLALRLYKDDLAVVFQAQYRVAWAILRLQGLLLRPFAILLVPLLLCMAQMGIRHQWRPLLPGEVTVITMKLHEDVDEFGEIVLTPNAGIVIEAGPVPGGGEVVWRVRGGEVGRHALKFRVHGVVVEKELAVGDRFQRVSAIRPGASWTTQLLHPAEAPLPPDSPVREIEIDFPASHSRISGEDFWVLTFCIVSLVVAFVFRPFFGVRF